MALSSNRDPFHPIGYDNRDEYILVPFHRVLKNTNMGIFQNLSKYVRLHRAIKTFPRLVNASHLDQDQFKIMVDLFDDPRVMINTMADGKLSEEKLEEIYAQVSDPLNLTMIYTSGVEEALRGLMSRQFTKKIYISCDSVTKEIGSYVADNLYRHARSFGYTDVRLIQGTTLEVFEEFPDITTCFLENANVMMDLAVKFMDRLKGRYFIVKAAYPDVDQRRYIDEFNRLMELKSCVISYMFDT